MATTGKSYLDVRQAFEDLGIGEATARRLGVRLYKVAMPFPLEPEGARRFADGLDTIVVVEEKRALIETQLKDVLYAGPDAPRILGKRDEAGRPLFPAAGRLDSNHIAVEIGRRLLVWSGDGGATRHGAHRRRHRPPTCSCSTMRGRRAAFPCRGPPSSGPSRSTASRWR